MKFMRYKGKYKINKDHYRKAFKKDCEINGFLTEGFINRVLLWLNPPLEYLYLKLLRKIEMFGSETNIPFLYRIRRHFINKRFRKLGLKLSFEIYPFSCGEGLRLLHLGGIIINPRARIGKNFTIRSFTVIGNKGTGCKEEVPVIGDNVEIGCNCSIIGGIRIGNNVTIGAGSVIITNVPDYAICVGNPGRVICIKEK